MESLVSRPLLSAPRAGILVLLARLGPYQAVGTFCECLRGLARRSLKCYEPIWLDPDTHRHKGVCPS